ncbi:MAG TPA: hydrogenase maturation protease [Candidatus Limnocylindrales bacterium]|nr:hydrogenase maturation protease [Candidatus Limnocylindrales bacterium]
MSRPVLVLACGTPDRGDDAAALDAVALLDLLEPQARGRATIRVVGQLGIEHLAERPDGAAVIVVDAAVGLRPGTVRFVPFAGLAGGARSPVPRSSHELPIPEVVGIAEILGGPLDGGLLVVGGSDFGLGHPLSPAVEAAIPELADQLAHAIEDAAGRRGPGGTG